MASIMSLGVSKKALLFNAMIGFSVAFLYIHFFLQVNSTKSVRVEPTYPRCSGRNCDPPKQESNWFSIISNPAHAIGTAFSSRGNAPETPEDPEVTETDETLSTFEDRRYSESTSRDREEEEVPSRTDHDDYNDAEDNTDEEDRFSDHKKRYRHSKNKEEDRFSEDNEKERFSEEDEEERFSEHKEEDRFSEDKSEDRLGEDNEEENLREKNKKERFSKEDEKERFSEEDEEERFSDEDEEENVREDDEEGTRNFRHSIVFRNSPWVNRAHRGFYKGHPEQPKTKYISVYYGNGFHLHEGSHRFVHCLYDNCYVTANATRADAVVFMARAFLNSKGFNFWKRPPHQRWVFYTIDPIIENYGLNNKTLKPLFNWTLTYKLDSDITVVPGRLMKNHYPPIRDYVSIFRKKNKIAAWFVSHCETNSRREEYVARMQKVGEVDIFGRCGPYKCGERHSRMTHDIPKCFPLLSHNYFFYLAYENSLCVDYVSEKFFKMFVDVQVIPVVRGGIPYNKVFPKGAFINADDFESPEALMRHLVALSKNEAEYIKLLQEKDRWMLDLRDYERGWMCQVCKKLHTDDTVGHYDDIHAFFNSNPRECWEPRDL